MPIRFYTHTDDNAPVLNGLAGSLITVLDACLVNGYGSKASLGWSKIYGDSVTGGYRRPTGFSLPTILQVNDNFPSGLSSRAVSRIKMIENATGFDQGFNIVPPTTTNTINSDTLGLIWVKSNALNSTPAAWTLIGDEKGFHLITLNSFITGPTISIAGCDAYFFGEFSPIVATDSFRDMLTGAIASNARSNISVPPNTNLPNSATNACWLLRDYNGIYIGKNSATYISNPLVGNSSNRIPNLLHGRIPFIKTFVMDSFDASIGGINGFHRGFIRNVRIFGGEAASITRLYPHNTIQTINGSQFYIADSTNGQFAAAYPISGEYDA